MGTDIKRLKDFIWLSRYKVCLRHDNIYSLSVISV